MRAGVHRFTMDHPGDVSALGQAIVDGRVDPAGIVAVIGKTEGNGGVNDFTRGYFTLALMTLLSRHLGAAPEAIAREIPCILSGGTEGVLSPHYVVLCRDRAAASGDGQRPRLAVGRAFSDVMPAEAVGRRVQIQMVAAAVRTAMADAGIDRAEDVRFVQVKCPCITAARAEAARRRGADLATGDPKRSMALARAAGAFGVALALGELAPHEVDEAALLTDFSLCSPRASISSGVEIEANEVVVLGNSTAWSGDLAVASRPMADAIDAPAVVKVLADLGIVAKPQAACARIGAVFVKCEPDRRGRIRGHRHTMLDDTDIDAQRHIRGAVAGLVAGLTGETQIFVSGGAEHQGPDGGGLIAVIARI